MVARIWYNTFAFYTRTILKEMTPMRKWLAILLVCVMLVATAACATAEVETTEKLPVEWDLDSIYASVEE